MMTVDGTWQMHLSYAIKTIFDLAKGRENHKIPLSTNLRFKNYDGEVVVDYLMETRPELREKYRAEDSECDSDCQATKTRVTAKISRVQEDTDSNMNYEIDTLKPK